MNNTELFKKWNDILESEGLGVIKTNEIFNSSKTESYSKYKSKITVISNYLDESIINNPEHIEILNMYCLGTPSRKISIQMRLKYPEIAKSNLRSNAQARFGHQGICKLINRTYKQALEFYKAKYEK